MPRFDYIRPHSLTEVIDLLNDPSHRSRLLAGGTDLLVQLRHHAPDFDRIIDISLLPELKKIDHNDDRIVLGAGVTYREVLENPLLQKAIPFLGEVALQVGGPQIRNTATLAGNIINAAPGADTVPVLLCLDAVVHLRSATGTRQLPLTEFILAPNRTQLQTGELLTHISFPLPPEGSRNAFIKVGRRHSQAISRLTVAAIGHTGVEGRVDFVRFAPGAATPHFRRFYEVEELFLGQLPTAELFAAAGEKAVAVMLALSGERWSTPYKKPVLATLTERVLKRVFTPEAND